MASPVMRHTAATNSNNRAGHENTPNIRETKMIHEDQWNSTEALTMFNSVSHRLALLRKYLFIKQFYC